MIKFLNKKSFLAFFAFIVFMPAGLYAAQNVSILAELEAAINVQETSITFITADIYWPSQTNYNLPVIDYGSVNFYGDAVLHGNLYNRFFNIDASDITFNNKIYFYNGGNANSGVSAGGAIYMKNGSALTFTGSDINFSGNGYTNYQGGAIFIDYSNILIENSTSVFYANKSKGGGAIFAGNSSNITIENSSAVFTSNRADSSSGGAIYASYSNITVENSTAVFANNNASYYGGAIGADNSNITIENSNAVFSTNRANWGGAINASNSNITFENSTAIFSDNVMTYGAAFDMESSTATFTGSGITFFGNIGSNSGSALRASANSNITIESSTAVFYDNSAGNGGAINLTSNAAAYFKGSDISFTSNTATYYGGAVYINISSDIVNIFNSITSEDSNVIFSGNKASVGGAIYVGVNSEAAFRGSTATFTGNIASSSGGAVYLDENSTAVFERSDITFAENKADSGFGDGGAIKAYNSKITADSSTVVFSSNSAGLGAAVYLYANGGNSEITFSGSTVTFNRNLANTHGGAILAYGSNVNIKDSTALFYNNYTVMSSGNRGGAIYAAYNSNIAIDNSSAVFSGNSGFYGGAAALYYGSNIIIDSSTAIFYDNSATWGGAIIAENSNITIEDSSALFSGNSATWGGAIYLYYSTMTIENSTAVFYNNRSEYKNINVGLRGGALFLESAGQAVFKGSVINFTSNTVALAGSGGAIYTSSKITIEDSSADFVANSAGTGGAVSAYAANIAIENSAAVFSGNFATSSGGAVFGQYDANITIGTSTALFSGNRAADFGGAVYLERGANAAFTNSNVNFSGNRANYGGAVSLYGELVSTYHGANITIEDSAAVFYNNYAINGGAVYLNRDANAFFKYSNITFTYNSASLLSAAGYGGAVYAADNSNITIENSTAVFSLNHAFGEGRGGAIYLDSGSDAFFKDSHITFSTNSTGIISIIVGYGGGAIYANASNISVENSTAVFSGNFANSGGAIYLRSSTAAFSGSYVNFSGNREASPAPSSFRGGGAVFATDHSNITFENSTAVFSGNSTQIEGGAIYLDGSTAVFKYSNVTFSNNVSSGTLSSRGGAIYSLNNSNITFENSTAVFSGNKATYGGAGYLGAKIDFKNSNMLFTNNTASAWGGAIYSPGRVNAENLTAVFYANNALSGGAISLGEGNAVFENSNVTFTSNTASNKGGAGYYVYGKITFSGSTVTFAENTADSGGANFVDLNSAMIFTGSTATFTGNTAVSSGGAIYMGALYDGRIGFTTATFTGSNIIFSGNRANNGGAIYIEKDFLLDFGDSQIKGIGNVAASSGGFIYSQGNGNIDINLDRVILISNTAATGGTFYAQNAATFTFSAAVSEIRGGAASYAGGYIALVENGTGDFRNTILKAIGNEAEKGGFMYLAGGNALFGQSSFENNEAKRGGALAILNGALIEFSGSEGIFRNNTAEENGGAIYAQGEEGNLGRAVLSVSSGNLIFEGNKANGENNDIYTGKNIEFEIMAAENSRINMYGGIKGVKESAIIKTGLGKLALLNNSVNEYYGEFTIERGIVEAGENAAVKFGKLNISDNGIYSVINNALQLTETGEANINGSMEIDVDLDAMRADMLKAALGVNTDSSGDVNLGVSSKLNLNLYGIASLGRNEITIIEADNGVTGRFSGDPFEGLGYIREIGGENPGLIYEANRVYISMVQGTNFEKELGHLTHNQREVARSADAIMSGSAINGEFLSVMNKLVKMGSEEAKKKGLDELSGAIIANMLSAGAYGNANEELFERMQVREEGAEEILNKIWGHGYGYGQERDNDENSTQEFSISGYGIEAGADLLTRENAIVGVYAGYERSMGKQGESKGDAQEAGAGLYGGWFGEKADIKGRIYGGKLSYTIKRELKLLEEKAESEIDGYSVKGDILAQYRIWERDGLSIMPYIQARAGYVANSGVRETGRGGANVEIYSGGYTRAEGILGIGIKYMIRKLRLYGKMSGGYAGLGDRAEYKGAFIDTGREMDIWGATGGRVNAGAAIGGEYEITGNWSVYANVNGNYYERGRGYYGNIGVTYNFNAGNYAEKDSAEILSEKEVLNVWKAPGGKDETVEIRKEIRESIGIEEGGKAYVMKNGERVFFFTNAEDAENFRKQGKSVKMTKTTLTGGKMSFEGYKEELGDTAEGMLIVQYKKGINEIKAIPEEAKRAQRNAIIEKALEENKASIEWDMEVEDGEVKISEKVVEKLGIKEGSSIYLLKYGRRVFLFKGKAEAEKFAGKLKKAGAKIDSGNIIEIEGLEIKEERLSGLKAEDIKELGDLSKGVRLEHYEKEKTTEVKSVAEEEKREKEEAITQEKVEESKERREKPMIKKYRLNVATFKSDEYELSDKAKKLIEEQAREIRKYNYNKITVEGHTDSLGSKDVNERISRLRAESVYEEFLINAIPVEKISYVGYGYQVPIESNDTKEGRAANRRTEIYVE